MVQPNTWEAHQQKPANSFHSVSIPWKILLKSKNIQTSNIPIDIKLHGNIMKSFFYPQKNDDIFPSCLKLTPRIIAKLHLHGLVGVAGMTPAEGMTF
jgi:hypothetical protein